jgi:hypothetical protein
MLKRRSQGELMISLNIIVYFVVEIVETSLFSKNSLTLAWRLSCWMLFDISVYKYNGVWRLTFCWKNTGFVWANSLGGGGGFGILLIHTIHTNHTKHSHKSRKSDKFESCFWQILWNFTSKSHYSQDSHKTIHTSHTLVTQFTQTIHTSHIIHTIPQPIPLFQNQSSHKNGDLPDNCWCFRQTLTFGETDRHWTYLLIVRSYEGRTVAPKNEQSSSKAQVDRRSSARVDILCCYFGAHIVSHKFWHTLWRDLNTRILTRMTQAE